MIPRLSTPEKFKALRDALSTLALGKVTVEEISDDKAVFIAPDINDKEKTALIDLIAGWIGRTPIARYQDGRLIITY